MSKKRSDITTSRPVIAYERKRTVYYESMSQAIEEYRIPSISMLTRMIERGQIWNGDGYTTFDWASS